MSWGRERQAKIYRDGALGRRPAIPADFATLEERASRRASVRAWAYCAGGAGEGATMRANRAAFERWAIVPRMLRDVSSRDLSVTLFGRTIPAPVLFAPVGASELLHPEGDRAIARAAAELGLPYVFSNQASWSMEDCAAVMGDSPRWFQLYWSTDEDLVDSFLARAAAVGCEAVVVTLDTTMLGWRPQDLNLGSLPFARAEGIAQYLSDTRFWELVRSRKPGAAAEVEVTLGAIRTLFAISRNVPGSFLANLRSPEPRAAVDTFLNTYSRPSLTWADVEGLRERTSLPILLKGVLHPDDARRAAAAGVDGIVVSNHGGRQVDGAIASLDALVDIVPAASGLTVLLDSGVRTGSDVFKALALGADAVLIGRPHIYGLALNGADGARDAVSNIVAELDLTLGLSGHTSVRDLDANALQIRR
ncbi:alpha-hydroxy-acid oxidizing protein [Solirubrobacter soli]|uniref:alpha-hydroxy-acid oxidizing protein n=1 Tax=Solirubrobacter soli TaxID=363832 RepID=UPI0004264337|nr:alpha-hydroxy-acid oxidizing protein [Solirubrobacter soli]